jgi:hypothetical protein
MPEPKSHTLTTTAQVERTYVVQAPTEEKARDRLRTHFKDPELLREGVVTEKPEKQTDTTPQRIKAINGKTVKETIPAKPEAAQLTTAGGGDGT